MLAVHLADESLEVLAFLLVVGVFLAARHRDLHDDMPGRVECSVVEQLAHRAQPAVDALRVVETVDAQEDHLWVAELCTNLPRSRLNRRVVRPGNEVVGVDRDRERTNVD